MKLNFSINTLNQLDTAVFSLSQYLTKGVFYLEGDLGSGKTAFVRSWLYRLGFQGIVNSPTYSLMQEYRIGNIAVIHADLYRLFEPEELIYLDVRDWKSRASLIFIEWAQQGKSFLPKADVICQFQLTEKRRFLSVKIFE